MNDFVVYNTNTSMLVAFNNLYSGAAIGGNAAPLRHRTAPNVMWAYEREHSIADGVTSTSVTLSEDGSQVIFVESSANPWLGAAHFEAERRGRWQYHHPSELRYDVDGHLSDLGSVVEPTAAACGACRSVPIGTTPPAAAMFPRRSGAILGCRIRCCNPRNKPPTPTPHRTMITIVTSFTWATDYANLHQFVNVFNGGSTPPTESTGTWPVCS